MAKIRAWLNGPARKRRDRPTYAYSDSVTRRPGDSGGPPIPPPRTLQIEPPDGHPAGVNVRVEPDDADDSDAYSSSCGDTDPDDCAQALEDHIHGFCTQPTHLCADANAVATNAGPAISTAPHNPYPICTHCHTRQVPILHTWCTRFFNASLYQRYNGIWTLDDGTHHTEPQPWGGTQSRFCHACETDELEHFRRKMTEESYAAAHPLRPGAQDRFSECTCLAQVAGPWYCFDCGLVARDEVLRTAASNAEWLRGVTRRPDGGKVLAHADLRAEREDAKTAVPCRCGREAKRPTEAPKATFCVGCGGVSVFVAADGGGGDGEEDQEAGKRVLANLAARFPLLSQGGTVDTDVELERLQE